MADALLRMAAIAALSLAAAACASTPPPYFENGVTVETPPAPLECVPYARAHSNVALRGDAWTWWDQAAGRYVRGHLPRPGAVLVFARDGGPPGGHVAVVRAIVSPREIRVDHANWLGDGRIFRSDPVRDVSPANDWSAVNVWNADTGMWGIRAYPVAGFVGPEPTPVAAREPIS